METVAAYLERFEEWKDDRLHVDPATAAVSGRRDEVAEWIAEDGDHEVAGVGDGDCLEEEQGVPPLAVLTKHDHRQRVADQSERRQQTDDVQLDHLLELRLQNHAAAAAAWTRSGAGGASLGGAAVEVGGGPVRGGRGAGGRHHGVHVGHHLRTVGPVVRDVVRATRVEEHLDSTSPKQS